MLKNFVRAKRTLAVLCVLLAGLSMVTPAFAQLDYDTYDIYQTQGEVRTLAGTIYVPQRAPEQPVYSEYWVLFPKYVYPSEKNPVSTEIVPSSGYHYTSVEDFFAKVPWGEGYRFVNVIAIDGTVLPGRTATTVN